MTGARPAGRFPASQRVRKRPEFQLIQARGRRLTTPHFTLLVFAREAAAGGTRIGITASRKSGGSVARSRAKRLIREAFRATRELWAADVDVVVVVRRPLGAMKLADVTAEWLALERDIRRRTQEARKDREKRDSTLAERDK